LLSQEIAIKSPHIQKKVQWLLKELSIEYKNIEPYVLSFIHRSIVNERNDYTPEHNERLEFLWDAVLELIITHKLYSDYPNTNEGDMTDMRSALVRWRNLAQIAHILGFSEYILLGKWEEKSGWRNNDYILANTFEAFLWALYTDIWYEAANTFVEKHVYSTLDHIMEHKLFKDFKTVLQEHSQAEYDTTPHYEVLSEDGPDHDKNYTVWVYLWDKKIGTGNGSSKKKAQEKAAENAYLHIKKW